MSTGSISISAESHFLGGPLSASVDDRSSKNAITLVDKSSGNRRSGQIDGEEDRRRIHWIENALEVGEIKQYLIEDGWDARDGVHMKDNTAGRLDVNVNGDLFTSYHYSDKWFRPYLHPVLGPHGLPVTRGYPMNANVPGESSDHPHHKGIWSAYGKAGGIDNWAEFDTSGRTIHRGFESIESGPVFGKITALGDWVSPDGSRIVLAEKREITVYATAPQRLLDFDLTLTATDTDVLFGDTKEGGFISLRVASSMEVRREGRLENSRGGVNRSEVWGKRAEWCDYSGPVGGSTVGVAVLENPSNVGHPTYWHSQDYGLMAANPFGLSWFLGEGHNGDYTLPAGESVVFSYRVYIHEGNAAEGSVAAMYEAYVRPPSSAGASYHDCQ